MKNKEKQENTTIKEMKIKEKKNEIINNNRNNGETETRMDRNQHQANVDHEGIEFTSFKMKENKN